MKKLETLLDKGILDRVVFKVILLVAVLITSVPYLHERVGGYVKFVLVYGLIIIVCEILTKRYVSVITDKMSIILILFTISYFVTVVVNRDLNFSSNFKTLIYMAVFFALLYMDVQEKSTKDLEKEIEIVSSVVVVGTFILSLACLVTFVFSISGEYRIESGLTYYGMYDHRLWGVYNANTGSTLNCISIILSTFFLTKPRKKLYRKFIIGNVVLQYICLLLTGSRAALYMLFALMIFATVIMCIRKYKQYRQTKKLRLVLICVVISGLLSGAFFATNYVVKEVVSYVPGVVNVIADIFVGDDDEPTEVEKYDLERLEEVENREGGFFTGRTDLWQASIKAFKKNPLFGITRENLYDSAQKYLENDLWAKNLRVGGAHNIYITILVSSGIVGFVLMGILAIYLMLKAIRVFVHEIDTINPWMLAAFMLMIMFFVTEFVEARILYQVNVFNVLFWIYCGYMAIFLKKIKKEEIVNEFH